MSLPSMANPPFATAPTIVIELPGPPQGKGRARFNRATGSAYTPASTRSYEGALKLAGALVMRGKPPLDGPLVATVEAYFPVPASWSKSKRAAALLGVVRPTVTPDADNLCKAALDGLNQILWRDDRQIVEVRIVKKYSDRPRLRIEVEGI